MADKATLDSLYADKVTLDSLVTDKSTLDSLYADKVTLDSLVTDKATLDSLYADKVSFDNVYANLAEILLADDNATIATTKAGEALTSANNAYTSEANALQYSQDALTNSGASSLEVSIPTSRCFTSGVSLSDTSNQVTFDSITYTGNGTAQSITTGMSTIDFTSVSNGTGFYHDRVAGDGIIKNDAGNIVASGSISFRDVAGVDGVCQVHIKRRNSSGSNYIYDGIRGVYNFIRTESTSVEGSNTKTLTTFTTTGFSVGSDGTHNSNGATFITYTTLYTHIKWGLTNQGKRYLEAFNPVTNDTMIMYQGSGLAGHEIPQSTGEALDFLLVKRLDSAVNWIALPSSIDTEVGEFLIFNTTSDILTQTQYSSTLSSTFCLLNTGANYNGLDGSFILYGKAKSKTWTIVPYEGTGVIGNFVKTLDSEGTARRPSRVIIKATSGAGGGWIVLDNARDTDGTQDSYILLNAKDPEVVNSIQDVLFSSAGFTHNNSGDSWNKAGVKYIALVEFDTNNTGTGGSYEDLPSATTNVQIQDTTFLYSEFDNGYKQTKETFAGTKTMFPINEWED